MTVNELLIKQCVDDCKRGDDELKLIRLLFNYANLQDVEVTLTDEVVDCICDLKLFVMELPLFVAKYIKIGKVTDSNIIHQLEQISNTCKELNLMAGDIKDYGVS